MPPGKAIGVITRQSNFEENTMIDSKTAPYGALLLRLGLGVMFIAHSLYLKLFVFTLAGTAGFFESLGLPGAVAYLVFAAEGIGGILLILGVQTRWVALALVPVLLGATWVHSGGGWEYPFFLTLAAVVQALLGDGAYALKASRERTKLSAKAA
jgi:putative oxidoreductase